MQQMQDMLPETVFLTDHDVGELTPISVIPFAATTTENPVFSIDGEDEVELLSIFLQSPSASIPTPSLQWLETCMQEIPTKFAADVTSEHTALSLMHGQRPAKTRARAGFVDFTKDHNLKARLEELQRMEDRTDEERKEMDDLAAILGCRGRLRSHKKPQHKTTGCGVSAGRVKAK